jgi:hypothetical protein
MTRDRLDVPERRGRLVDRAELVTHEQQLGGHRLGVRQGPRRTPGQQPDVVEAHRYQLRRTGPPTTAGLLTAARGCRACCRCRCSRPGRARRLGGRRGAGRAGPGRTRRARRPAGRWSAPGFGRGQARELQPEGGNQLSKNSGSRSNSSGVGACHTRGAWPLQCPTVVTHSAAAPRGRGGKVRHPGHRDLARRRRPG